MGDQRNTRFYYEGKTFALESPQQKLYATKEAPATIDEFVNAIREKYGITIPMSNLFVSDPCGTMASNIQESTYIGYNMVDREPGYHIQFTGEERDFQIWISEGDRPLPLKVVITYKKLPVSPQYTAVFSNWNLNPTIASDTFKFTPPADAHPIKIQSATAIGDTP